MSDPSTLSLVAAAREVASGERSSEELTAAVLARARQGNAVLGSYLRLDADGALAAARAADAARARGERLGVLHGVPLALKDMFYDPGRETGGGSRVRAGHRAATLATVRARLAAAGAIDLGSLAMTEFALGPTGHNAFHGPVRNPWSTAHIAGGSSSGAGAAVAARAAFGALGSDTGGSIRIPAAACGVLGLKPTYGRVSRAGAMRLSWSLDHVGPLARTAADLARLLGVIAGADAADPTASARPVPDYEARLPRGVGGLVVGVAEAFYLDEAHPEVRHLVERALAVFEGAGARIERLRLPPQQHLTELGRAVLYGESAALHGHWLRTRAGDYSPQVRARAATGLAIPAASYLEALLLRPHKLREFVDSAFAQCDIVLTATLLDPVPTLAATDVGGGEAMWRTIARLVHCTAPFNYLGLPALALPVGFTPGGLPASVQLVAPPFAESRLLNAAAAYQAHTDWHERLPPPPAPVAP